MFTWILNAAGFFHFIQTYSSERNCGAETNPLPADGFGILTASWQAVEQQRCSTIINMAQQPGGCNKNPPKSELPRGKKWLKNQFLAQWLLLAVKTHLMTVFIIKSIIFTWNPFKKKTLLDPNSCWERASDDSVTELWTLGVIKHRIKPWRPSQDRSTPRALQAPSCLPQGELLPTRTQQHGSFQKYLPA